MTFMLTFIFEKPVFTQTPVGGQCERRHRNNKRIENKMNKKFKPTSYNPVSFYFIVKGAQNLFCRPFICKNKSTKVLLYKLI